MHQWLAIVGIGEDGTAGLTAIARTLITQAEILVGGDRHLAMVAGVPQQERLVWASPIQTTIAEILQRRGKAVCVLASGDPMCYGIGGTLTQHIPIAEMTIVPIPSTFSFACARLGWALPEVETLSLCGRPLALLSAYLYAGARILILSEGAHTPALVAELLTQQGFGKSTITVLERLGGAQERLVSGTAATWSATNLAALNAIALDCVADPGVRSRPRLPGLPDAAYHHDGQLTKREIRAVTLSTLAPCPGELLWDVGAGCGSIAIEWLRSHARCRAIAIEQNGDRRRYIAENAAALGTPQLQIVAGKSPAALQGLPAPDAIFIGGGATAAGVFDACWTALRPGGRLVANAVTIASEQQLLAWQQQVGGDLTRIAVQRAAPIGTFLGWKPLVPVTQWHAIKPDA